MFIVYIRACVRTCVSLRFLFISVAIGLIKNGFVTLNDNNTRSICKIITFVCCDYVCCDYVCVRACMGSNMFVNSTFPFLPLPCPISFAKCNMLDVNSQQYNSFFFSVHNNGHETAAHENCTIVQQPRLINLHTCMGFHLVIGYKSTYILSLIVIHIFYGCNAVACCCHFAFENTTILYFI